MQIAISRTVYFPRARFQLVPECDQRDFNYLWRACKYNNSI